MDSHAGVLFNAGFLQKVDRFHGRVNRNGKQVHVVDLKHEKVREPRREVFRAPVVVMMMMMMIGYMCTVHYIQWTFRNHQ